MNTFVNKKTSLIAKITFTLLLIVSTFLIGATSANAISVASSANPAWPNKCGLKIGLLIDRSNSISTSEGTQMKNAAKGFVDALTGTPSQVAVAQFRKTATQTLGLTSITTAGGATTVKNTIDGYGFGTSDSAGSTNWEAAFYTQQSVAADVVVIITDGNPTQRNLDGSGGNGSSDGSDFNIDAGITRANELKAQGKRVVAVGIGDDLDVNNLKAVSGPTVNEDYFTASFETLNAKLVELATKICGGTVTVIKQVKNADGSYTATNGWDYIATNAVTTSKTTAGSGTAEFKYEGTPKTTTITETVKAGYSVESISCLKNGVATGTVSSPAVTLTVEANDIISCTFKNTRDTGTLQIKKLATGGNDTFGFTSNSALGNFNLTTAGGTAQTAVTTVNTGTYDVTENAIAGWSLTGISCTGTTPIVASPKVTVTVGKGQNVVCTFTNARQNATLTVVKNAVGGNATFGFTSNTALSNFNLTTVGGTKSTTPTTITTGAYEITESALTDWSLTSATCTGTTATKVGSKLTFTATADANIVCTFTNTRDTGTIQIIKNTVGGNGTFIFTTNSALGNPSLTTVGGTAQTSAVSVNTGVYNLAETVPSGWTLTGLVCTGGTSTVTNPSVSVTVGKGQNIVCTYTNTRDTATVKVIKNTIGGNGTFQFTSNSALGNFGLTTVSGTAQTSVTTIPTGSYDITESALSGWTLTGLSCSGTTTTIDGSKVTITATKGATIVCTYTNTRDTGTIQVVKNTVGGNGTFSFTSNTPLGNFPLTTSSGTAQTAAVSLPTGDYAINEVVPAGWSLSTKTCVASNPIFSPNGPLLTTSATGVTVRIDKNANVVCTFTNTRDQGSITIVKNTVGGNGTFSFSTSTPLGSPSLTTVGGTKSSTTLPLDTGVYNLAEDAKSGWTLTGLVCTGTNATPNYNLPSVSITVAKGENVICTFTNTRDTGTLKIVKTAVGGNGTFNFTTTSGALGNPSITTAGGTGATSVTTVDTATYDITETVPSGWTLSDITCVGNTSGSLAGPKVTVVVGKGQNVVCTFTNTRDRGTIKVVKNTVGGDGTFGFTSNTTLGATFNLTTANYTNSTSATGIDSGVYNIAEDAKTGWTLTAASCTGGAAVKNGSSLSVTVAKGAIVVCTFENTRDQGTVQVVKNTVGGNGTFDFNTNIALDDFSLTTVGGAKSTSVVNADTGSYSIAETVPTGWTLSAISCTGGSADRQGDGVSVEVNKGATVVCTFTNTRDTGSIKIVKKTSGGNGTFSFTSDSAIGSNFNITTAGGSGETANTTVDTGDYTFTESAKSGWTLDDIECNGGTSVENGTSVKVTVAKGANVVCTFDNTRDTAKLTVVKNVTAAAGITNGSFDFTSDTTLANFNLTTVGGTKSTASVDVPTGDYSVSETSQEGWSLTSLSCSGIDDEEVTGSSVSIGLEKGAVVVCTFTNRRDTATIQVVKNVTAAGGVSDGSFDFTSDSLLGNFNLTTDAGTASTEVVTIPTGKFDITETSDSDWNLTGISCTGDKNDVDGSTVSISAGKGENIVCTFTNKRKTAKLTIVKNVTAAGGISNGTFDFESDTVLGNFNLTTVDGTKSTETVDIPSGGYDISEIVPEGWSLTGAECTNAEYLLEDSTISFGATAGLEIVCTFTNQRDTGDITVVKNVIATAGVTDGTYDFTSDIDLLGDFSLTTDAGTASTETISVPTGEYNIDEIVPEGWNLNSVSCVDQNQEEDLVRIDANQVAAASATAVITSGSDVVCTFENQRNAGTLTIKEVAIGGNGLFGFTSDTPLSGFGLTTVAGTASTTVVEIATGTYVITQSAMPTSVDGTWALTNIACTGATTVRDGAIVTITVETGADAVCTFTDVFTQVLGTVVTRIDPPVQVAGISASNLPATGFQSTILVFLGTVLVAVGALFFSATRRKRIRFTAK